MLLLYDNHCYICSLGTLLLAKLSRGFIRPVPLEEGDIRELDRIASWIRPKVGESSWLLTYASMLSGLNLVPTAVLGIFRGLAYGRGFKSTFWDVYRPGRCSISLPCRGAWALLVRTLYFISRNSRIALK